MKKATTLLIILIAIFSLLTILLSIYMRDTAEFRLNAKKERAELLEINQQQLKILKKERCE